jgi:hypothetical protein
MSRKHMPLLIGGLVVLLLAAVLLYLLFSAKKSYDEDASKLQMETQRLQRLTRRAVFPSETNVQTMGKQLGIYQEYLDELYAEMKKGQPAAAPVNRDGFRRLLEEGLRRLMNDARTNGVTLAPNLAFGVQRYIEGAAPTDEELPRVVDQFRSIAGLCTLLFNAKIGELTGVERTVFERDAQAAAPVEEEYVRRGARGQALESAAAAAPATDLFRDADGLFTKERYLLTFRAQDTAIWKVLDRLSKGAPFVVVTKLEIVNPARPAVVPPKTEEPAAAPRPASTAGWQAAGARSAPPAREEPAVLPRELRVVAGQELSNVRLEVELYRFAEAAVQGEENP